MNFKCVSMHKEHNRSHTHRINMDNQREPDKDWVVIPGKEN